MNPLHVAAGEGKLCTVLGIPIRIRVHGRDTGGSHSVVESADRPGGEPPPHIHHREAETFQVLEGEYEFRVGDQKLRATKGATLYAPQGVPHGYRCLTPSGLLSVTITPAGFERFFEEVGALSPAQQEIPRVIELGKKYGLEFLPPPTA
jgi:quercetin dioxygenase-like cupin family protein